MEGLRSCLVCHTDLMPGVTYIAPLLSGGTVECLRQVCSRCGEVYDQAPVHHPGPPADQMSLPPISLPPRPETPGERPPIEPSRVIMPEDMPVIEEPSATFTWHHGSDPIRRNDDVTDALGGAFSAHGRLRALMQGKHYEISPEMNDRIRHLLNARQNLLEDMLLSGQLKGFGLRKDDEEGGEDDGRSEADGRELQDSADEQG